MARTQLMVFAVLLAGATAIATVLAKTTGVFPAPRTLAPTALGTGSSLPARVLDAEVWLATPTGATVVVLVFSCVAYRWGGWRYALLVPAAAAVVAVTSILKAVGPPTALPSGHAAFATAVFGLGAWMAFRRGRQVLAGALAVVGAAMGPARVLEGAHHVPDVLAGDALGLAWLIALGLLATSAGRFAAADARPI